MRIKDTDIELFINRRDFPLLTRDETEPYNNIWDGTNIPLISHNYPNYIPILSMATGNRYADIAIPTWEDWTRVQTLNNIWFPDSCRDYNEDFNKDWDTKIPTAYLEVLALVVESPWKQTCDLNYHISLTQLLLMKKAFHILTQV